MRTPDTTILGDMRARDKYKITELEAEIGILEMMIEDYPGWQGLLDEIRRKQAQIEQIKLRK